MIVSCNTNYSLTESEVCREVSNGSLVVLTKRQRGECVKTEVSNFRKDRAFDVNKCIVIWNFSKKRQKHRATGNFALPVPCARALLLRVRKSRTAGSHVTLSLPSYLGSRLLAVSDL